MTRAEAGRIRRPAAARREQILSVAADAFALAGFRGTSLAEVAARVGVSQPGLLHHFGSKEVLILAVLQQRDLQDEQFVETQFKGVDATTREWLMAFCRRNETQPGLVRLFTVQAAESLDPAHPAHEFFLERNRRVRNRIERLVTRDQEKGLVPAGLDPAAVATELVAVMNGLQLQWLRDPSVDMCGIFEASLRRLGTRGGSRVKDGDAGLSPGAESAE
ncbi:AcrR family transcriptional regulator [Kibdelosporangium banguiense]|uniref:AcrR family transcriptional regulator n=1 Tax=Kibdelosporangium banguiense TaxID=1365924 RepID=A0ABS4TU64_9PSEU|nr:TetR/AcrR family transcriptional regulator [Kibdelosporangium banguiense]MBP2327925.1 AcrR family transcriptional regulator [Kibdelosporangium banguiense]